jgi:quinoprotein glucose dehydrogenase
MKKYLPFLFLLPLALAWKAYLPHQQTPDPDPQNDWAWFGHDLGQSKYSPLDQINPQTLSRLKQVWTYEALEPNGASVLFNPLVVKGVMYALMPSQSIVALEAATGKKRWEFVPDAPDKDVSWTKGIYFHAGKNGRPDALFYVAGSTLYRINAADGQLISSFGKGGKVDFYTGLDVPPQRRKDIAVTSNAPGVVYGDLYIIGCKVPDELPSISGDIRAFNVYTGKLEWVFHTIPKKGEYGADTWPVGARNKNGGANCWGGMALDEKRGIVFVPTASPSFDFYGGDREGQNLFANCLLALDAKTGKRLWHFQTTHHDLWDRDNGSPPNLITVDREGKKIDAVALATKIGYVYVFNRETGEAVFPIDEVPVSTASEMPNEKPWPTQPIPRKPGPFARQGFTEDLFSDIRPETAKFVREEMKNKRYKTGIYEPPGLDGSVIVPAAHGGSNWGGAAYNPLSGVMFVNAVDLPWFHKLVPIKGLDANNDQSGEKLYQLYCSSCHGKDRKGNAIGPNIAEKAKTYPVKKLEQILKRGVEPMPSFKHLPQVQIDAIVAYLKDMPVSAISKGKKSKDQVVGNTEPYTFAGYGFWEDPEGYYAIKPPYGTLTAIDLNAGEIRWQVPLGENHKAAKLGLKNSGDFNRGGCIVTAGGLVFIAATGDRILRAFEQKTGKVLWESLLPGMGTSIPASFAVDGKQYLCIGVSPNDETKFKGGYLTFALE